jgi:hypothetical protein
VGGPERNPAFDEQVGRGSRGAQAVVGSGPQPGVVDVERGHHAGHHRQRCPELGSPVQERWDRLLEIALVGERQALQDSEDRGERAGNAGRLRPDQLGRVGVALLGQHR